MKTIFRLLSMTALLAGIAVTGVFAQDPCSDVDTPTAQYEKFLTLYNKKPPVETEVQEAIDTGKTFLEKFGSCEAWKEQSAFVKPQVARLEKLYERLQDDKKFKRFDGAVNADNADDTYAAGKEILSKFPNDINIQFVMAVANTREVSKKNYKYNADSLKYAKSLYDYLKGGGELTRVDNKGVKTNTIGALKYEMNRENAMSELVYTLGFTTFYGQNNKKGAMPYYYELTQIPGFRKNYAPVYATIGEYYLSEREPIGEQIAQKIEAVKAAATDEEKAKIDNEEVKPRIALFKGYTERALDAFSRAWSLAKDDTPAGKTYKDGLYKQVAALYERRFEKTDGVNQWVSAAIAKPLPDPTSAVQPIVEAETTTTTNTTGAAAGTGTGIGAANGTGIGAATGTGIGAAKGTGVGAASGKTVTTVTTAPASPAKSTVANKPKPKK